MPKVCGLPGSDPAPSPWAALCFREQWQNTGVNFGQCNSWVWAWNSREPCPSKHVLTSFPAALGGSKKASSSQLTRHCSLWLSTILTAYIPFCFYLLIWLAEMTVVSFCIFIIPRAVWASYMSTDLNSIIAISLTDFWCLPYSFLSGDSSPGYVTQGANKSHDPGVLG